MVDDLLPQISRRPPARRDDRAQGTQRVSALFLFINQRQRHGRYQQHIGRLVTLYAFQCLGSVKFELRHDGAADEQACQQALHVTIHVVHRQ